MASAAQAAATATETALKEAQRRRRDPGRVHDKLADQRENFADLLAHAEPGPAPATLLEDDAALHSRADAVERALRDLRRRWQTLDGRRQAAAQEVRTWIARPEHEGIQTPWARHLGDYGEAALKDGAARLGEQLRLRAVHLAAQIEEADRHRGILVDEVLAVAEEGLKLLRTASNLSRLPDHVPGLGGTHFLRITAEAPDNPEERRGRIGELVDQLAATDRPLGGIALVQATVRRLARPVHVRVLHPDATLERQP